MSPLVSVIIPTFNRAHYLAASIQSILAQTLQDFELIIVDDGSTDETLALVSSLTDKRIRLVSHTRNLGIPASRNAGLAQARGTFTAWLDSDDLARPERLEKQVAYLDSNPGIALVGGCAGKVDREGRPLKGLRIPPLEYPDIKAWLLFRSAFQQSSIMGRTDILRRYQYSSEYPVCEDLDVFIRMAKDHVIMNMPAILIDRRIHPDQTIRTLNDIGANREARLLSAQVERLGVSCSTEDANWHILLGNANAQSFERSSAYLHWADDWLKKLLRANLKSRYVDPASLRFAVAFFWANTLYKLPPSLPLHRRLQWLFSSSLPFGLVSARSMPWLRSVFQLATAEKLFASRNPLA